MTLFKTLKKQNQKYKLFLIFYLTAALTVSVTSVIVTRITGDMGQAAIDLDTGTIMHFLLIISGLTLLRAAASALSALFLARFSGKVGYHFRNNFAKFFLQRPFADLEKTNTGESLSIYSNDLPQAVQLVSGHGLRIFTDIIFLVVTFVYMLTLNPMLTLIFFGLFPLLAFMQIVISGPIQKKYLIVSEKTAHFNAIVNDSLQNTSTITAYSLEATLEKRYLTAYDEYFAALKSYARSLVSLVMVGLLASMSPQLIISAVAAHNVINGNMNIAEFIAFTTLALSAASWLLMLSQNLSGLQVLAAGAKRMNENMEGSPEDLTDTPLPPSSTDIAVSASSLTFSYGEDLPPALNSISFQIKKGTRTAFVGGSGSGKSTILKLLLGLYAPGEGQISVMGTDINTLSKAALRSAFAYVPQDSFLFPESIGENITGEKTKTPSDLPRLEKACRDAGIWDFIQTLPDTYNAVLNESAENISGGQKQRIALARALYQDAPIILFDEATSALDPATEGEILKTLAALPKDKTIIMIAHRTQAIDFCDEIINMENGQIEGNKTEKAGADNE